MLNWEPFKLVRMSNRFWPLWIGPSVAARSICVNAVLGWPYNRWLPQPTHDSQTHDKDIWPSIPVWLFYLLLELQRFAHFWALLISAFHLFYRLCELVKLQSSCKKLNLLSELMDHSGNYVHTVLPHILSLLQQGLGQRIHLLTHSLSPDPEVGNIYIWL